MGLFSILKQDATVVASDDDEMTKNRNSSTNRALPTIVQLYARGQPVLSGSATKAAATPPYAWLTYQAVCSTEILGTTTTASGPSLRKSSSAAQQQQSTAAADLGIWNCRVVVVNPSSSSTTSTTTTTTTAAAPVDTSPTTTTTATTTGSHQGPLTSESLLRHVGIGHSSNTFFLTVDFVPPYGTVEPTVTLLQNALIRHLVESNSDSSNSKTPLLSQTTSLSMLRTAQFGLANQDETYTAPAIPMSDAASNDDDTKIAVMLVVRMPHKHALSSTSQQQEDDSYTAQQQKALLLYHWRKFAVALQATLVFVDESKDATTAGSHPEEAATGSGMTSTTTTATTTEQPCLSAAELAVLARAWAQGAPIWQDTHKYLEEAGLGSGSSTAGVTTMATTTPSEGQQQQQEEGGDTTSNPASVHALVYGPGAYQQDLLDTVLLRAAQYPGHWDAAKDSVWKILPPSMGDSHNSTETTSSNAVRLADQGWLSELRQSIVTSDTAATGASSMVTPEPKKKKSSDTATPAGGKTPNEAAAFFESLLK